MHGWRELTQQSMHCCCLQINATMGLILMKHWLMRGLNNSGVATSVFLYTECMKCMMQFEHLPLITCDCKLTLASSLPSSVLALCHYVYQLRASACDFCFLMLQYRLAKHCLCEFQIKLMLDSSFMISLLHLLRSMISCKALLTYLKAAC